MKHFFSFEELVGTAIKEYRLEYIIEQNALDATFLARCPGTRQMYQCRLLNWSGFSSEERQAYLGQFQQEASKIAALQHPTIHPLLEYGDHNGMPYLISSYIPPCHSLATHLKTSGPLDMAEAGYYQDTLTSALEYAHLHGISHGNLTPEVIFIPPTSSSASPSVIIADIGVAGLQRLSKRDNQQRLLSIWRLSPDRTIGNPKQYGDGSLTPASDKSALGTILYQMLTGYSVLESEQEEHDMGELSHHTQANHAIFSRRKAMSLLIATGAVVAVPGIVWASQKSGKNAASSLLATAGQGTPLAPQASVSPLVSQTSAVIARTADIPVGRSVAFKIPGNGSPGVLIHLPTNNFVAFNAVCTHEGCTVAYNPQTNLIACPCHGSVFDPTKNAAVVRGPARTALPAVQMTVNADGTITAMGTPSCSTGTSKSQGGGDD